MCNEDHFDGFYFYIRVKFCKIERREELQTEIEWRIFSLISCMKLACRRCCHLSFSFEKFQVFVNPNFTHSLHFESIINWLEISINLPISLECENVVKLYIPPHCSLLGCISPWLEGKKSKLWWWNFMQFSLSPLQRLNSSSSLPSPCKHHRTPHISNPLECNKFLLSLSPRLVESPRVVWGLFVDTQACSKEEEIHKKKLNERKEREEMGVGRENISLSKLQQHIEWSSSSSTQEKAGKTLLIKETQGKCCV